MKGLMLKDLILIRNSLSPVFLFPLVVILLCGSSSAAYLAAAFEFILPLFAGFLLYNVMYAEENSHWRRFEIGLPISYDAALRAKYILGMVLVLVAAALDFIAALVFPLLGVEEHLAMTFALLATVFGILYVAVLIPSVLKFGVSKGPIVFIGCIVLLTLAPFALSRLHFLEEGITTLLGSSILPPLALTVGLVLVFCSYLISVRIQRSE